MDKIDLESVAKRICEETYDHLMEGLAFSTKKEYVERYWRYHVPAAESAFLASIDVLIGMNWGHIPGASPSFSEAVENHGKERLKQIRDNIDHPTSPIQGISDSPA